MIYGSVCLGIEAALLDTVLDPFGGAGTTALAANRISRHAAIIELNPEYAALAKARIVQDGQMLANVQMVSA